ncbi:hypothetical protein G6F22_018641 [Rhizopus arrhizus]|nr:hypothetical protein G6F22_018641 [Rhizopus arrhizus]
MRQRKPTPSPLRRSKSTASEICHSTELYGRGPTWNRSPSKRNRRPVRRVQRNAGFHRRGGVLSRTGRRARRATGPSGATWRGIDRRCGAAQGDPAAGNPAHCPYPRRRPSGACRAGIRTSASRRHGLRRSEHRDGRRVRD